MNNYHVGRIVKDDKLAEFKSQENFDWKNMVLSPSATMREALETLNNNSVKVVLVCIEDFYLVGTITDGDIRRGLVRGFDLVTPIEKIMNKEPITAKINQSQTQVTELMYHAKLSFIPVVDMVNKLVTLRFLDFNSTKFEKKNKFVIMAGGKGKRLLPLTNSLPKPMLEVLGKPVLEHIIIQAKRQGFRHFLITIHHLGDSIRDYFGDGRNLGVYIEYVEEEAPLGTAGSLTLIESVGENPLLVTNGDVLTQLSYEGMIEFHNKHNSFATMAVHLHEWQNPFGVVEVDGMQIAGYQEKPIIRSIINSGVYVLDPEAISLLNPNQYCDMPYLFQRAREQNKKVMVFPIYEEWIDIGRPEDLTKASTSFVRGYEEKIEDL